MEKFEDQYQPLTFFHLYCLNIKCKLSIYHHGVIIKTPFTVDNLVSDHLCSCCKSPMSSAMDMEIKHLLAGSISNRKMGLQ
jgi:hypothetical protein